MIDSATMVAGIGKRETGEIIKSQARTEETTNLNIIVEVKNFGLVPGINYFQNWDMFVDGVLQPGHKVPDRPTTIFPGQSFHYVGIIGKRQDYLGIMNGKKILTFEVVVEYDGPGAHYKECNKQQYVPELSAFVNLGPTCTKLPN